MNSIYNTYIIDNSNNSVYTGQIKCLSQFKDKQISVSLEKNISLGLDTVYEEIYSEYINNLEFQSLSVNGTLNSNSYSLNSRLNKNKLNISFENNSVPKKENYKIRHTLIENNTFYFVLFPFINKIDFNNIELYVPHSSQFININVERIVSNEIYKFKDELISCDRYLISARSSFSINQYCLFCNKTGRLIATFSDNQSMNIENIIE